MNNEGTEIDDGLLLISQDKEIYLRIKRIMDIILSFVIILMLLPLLIIIYLLVKFDGSKGEVFFKQKRVGLNEKEFYIYKFRSMHPDAEEKLEEISHLNEIEGHMFKIKNDPRITKIGAFIRAYSIDELPQLFNVLIGDMSLIGPRPPLVSEFENYSNKDKKRLQIKPGISGLWQVSGRNSLSFKEMVELDIKYIKTLSYKEDFKIFFKTVVVVLMKDSAY